MADLREAFGLSKAEDRVARLILSGQHTKAIAFSLGITPTTVQAHVKAILKKTASQRQTDFIRSIAIADGWNAGQYAGRSNQ